MHEAIGFISRHMCRSSTIKLMEFLLTQGYATSSEIKDEKLTMTVRYELIYMGLLQKFIKDGKKCYTLTGPGSRIAKAMIELVDAVHEIVPELEEV